MLPGWLVLACVIWCGALSALAVGPTRTRKAASILLAAVALLLGLAPRPDPPLLATLCGLFSLVPSIKISQLLADNRVWPARFRVWHVLSPFDARETRRAEPALEGRRLAAAVIHGSVATAACIAAVEAPLLPGYWPAVGRTLGGAVGVYSGTAALAGLVIVFHRLTGIVVPPIHLRPIASRSVAEFWGRRWNRPVHAWLRSAFFVPIARRGHAHLGVLAAFAASAAIHAWIVLVATGAAGGASMVGFFALQGGLVVAEDALSVRRWPSLAARAWTIGLFLLGAPLFLFPFLTALGL